MLKLEQEQDFIPPQFLCFQLCGKHCEDAAPLFLQAHKKACQQKWQAQKLFVFDRPFLRHGIVQALRCLTLPVWLGGKVPFRVQSQAFGARGALLRNAKLLS